MLASHKAKLDDAIAAVEAAYAQALAMGLHLEQVNLKFPDGTPVVFQWDAARGEFQIVTT